MMYTFIQTHAQTQDGRTPRWAAVQAEGPEREDEQIVY